MEEVLFCLMHWLHYHYESDMNCLEPKSRRLGHCNTTLSITRGPLLSQVPACLPLARLEAAGPRQGICLSPIQTGLRCQRQEIIIDKSGNMQC